MNILHLVSGELTGGAARGAYWLHQALERQGVSSRILNKSAGAIKTDNVDIIPGTVFSAFREKLDRLPLLLYPSRERKIFSTGLLGNNFLKTPAYEWADIVHLHWINRSFVGTRHLSKINKPIVWTMRDMWPMTGGCHCAMECTRYTTGCGKCPQLNSNRNTDLSSYIIRRKSKHIPKHTKLVGISNWLCECAKKSFLFQDFDVQMIHNGINLDDYTPVEKSLARSILSIDTRKKIVLTGAQNAEAFYRGFDRFLAATKHVNKDDIFLLLFGDASLKAIHDLQIEYRSLGFLYDATSLKLAYSAADVFVAPSLMDAFGKTLAESLACGTPVVCFDATGPKDIVDHKINGYKAIPFEHEDLAAGIKWVLANTERHRKLCLEARRKAKTSFNINNIAIQYSELYRTLLGDKED